MLPAEQIADLQSRIAEGDDSSAYKELYHLLYYRLHAFAQGIVRNHEVAEEIVSDVFVKLWQQRARLSQINNLTVYLYVATKNLSYNYLLRRQKETQGGLHELMQVSVGRFSPSPEQLLISEEMVRKIEDAIQHLPPKCKLIFKLVKEDGLKYKEIAEILQISVKTIDAQLAIALRKIKKAIQFDLSGNTNRCINTPPASH